MIFPEPPEDRVIRELRAKLDASERACADHKAFLNGLRQTHDLDVPEEVWSALFSIDAGRDYVSLAFHEQEMKDLERERQYVADKLMQKGDHSLPEAVDRWVSDYVPREKLERAQMGCALVRTLATVLRANHPPEHQAYKIAQDIEERLADRGHDYVPKSEVEKAWRKGMTEAMGIAANSLDGVIAAQRILAARDARKAGVDSNP